MARSGRRCPHGESTDRVLCGNGDYVAPDGVWMRSSRIWAPVRIPTAAIGAPVDIKLSGFAHRFGPQHRVRLTLATTDATSYNNKVADLITVTSGPGTQFVLPVATVVSDVVRPPVVTPPVIKPTVGGPKLPATGLPWLLPLAAVRLIALARVTQRTRGHNT